MIRPSKLLGVDRERHADISLHYFQLYTATNLNFNRFVALRRPSLVLIFTVALGNSYDVSIGIKALLRGSDGLRMRSCLSLLKTEQYDAITTCRETSLSSHLVMERRSLA